MTDSSRKIVSVITVNLNDKDGLQRTIDSVKAQNSSALEHIIVDGGSTDGSAEVVKQNAGNFSYWVSEPDKGVYDAQNKGIKQANGKYLIFLNSGDTFFSDDVIGAFVQFSRDKMSNIIYGNSNVIKSDGSSEKLVPPSKLNLNFWYRNTLNHQAVFFKKEVFLKHGSYNTDYRFCADMELLLKVFKKEPDSFLHFDHTVCNYHEVGVSAKRENYDKVIAEKERILKTHLSEKEYSEARAEYVNSQTFRTRMRLYISSKPWLKKLVGKLYSK